MPISVVCSHCQRKLKVADQAAGKRARCPLCKGVITIPQVDEFVEPDDFVEPEDETVVDTTPKKPKKKAAWDEGGESSKKSGNPDDDNQDYGFSEEEPKKKKKPRYEEDEEHEDEEDKEERERRERKRLGRRLRKEYGPVRRNTGVPHRGVVILVLGIVALVLSGIPIIAWVLGGITVNMANTDLAKMETRAMDRSGEGVTKIGKALAIVAVGVGLIVFIILFILNIGSIVSQKGGGKF